MKKPVLLIGSYGRGNVGDDMFLAMAIELFKDHQIYVNSSDDSLLPIESMDKVTTVSTSISGDFFKKIKMFLKIKTIVYWGGDVWVKYYGDRFERQPLYKMLVVNTIARIFNKQVFYLGCGIGDLHGYDLFLARLSARLSNRIVVREIQSKERMSISRIKVLPDIASVITYYGNGLKTLPTTGKINIAISVLYYIPNPSENFEPYINSIAEFVNSLDTGQYKLTLLPMLTSASTNKNDLWASAQLISKITSGIEVAYIEATNLKETIIQIKEFYIIIGSRLHANILGILAGVPCIGISYRPKVASFFKTNNLNRFYIEFNELSKLNGIFKYVMKNYNSISREIQEKSDSITSVGNEYKTIINNEIQ